MDFRDIKEFIKDTSKYIIIALMVLVIMLYIISLQQVVGPSMFPTLNNNDVILIDKISYRFSNPKRNEIISFQYAETKYLIKRIIGLPGEHISYKDGILYIDGDGYTEKSLLSEKTLDFDIKELGFDTIPNDMYLVLGDNRGNSLDSRSKKVGLINKKDIIGKILIKIWPLNQAKIVK
ncbi:MAG: signal peptidase I [Bacilli bacterium]